jgi:glycosyltransferase involved in cell wall biosynthesis
MASPITVFMPAYRAEGTIVPAVQSVVNQTFADWRLVIVADDGGDYEAVLGRARLRDKRFTFLSSGKVKGGSSRARNIGLDAVDSTYGAILDADDRMRPTKLALASKALDHHAIVSCALDVMDEEFRHLRFVGTGPDRAMSAAEHKWTSFSMDSMLCWDRRKTDARYDPALPNMTDLDFLLKLWAHVPGGYHLGTPLHDYVKVPTSMSNAPGFTERMIHSKRLILSRLAEGHYPMADDRAVESVSAFLRVSLDAEADYPAALAKNPEALFEDTIEPRLRGYEASTSLA